MPFLPFYIPGKKRLNIIIAGGGYAGVAALVTLLRHMPQASITIIDPATHHLKITHLHETFRYPLEDFLIPFSTLENRFGCRHVQAELIAEEGVLQRWQNDRFVTVNDEILEFDYLLIASGAPIAGGMVRSPNVLDLYDFFPLPDRACWSHDSATWTRMNDTSRWLGAALPGFNSCLKSPIS